MEVTKRLLAILVVAAGTGVAGCRPGSLMMAPAAKSPLPDQALLPFVDGETLRSRIAAHEGDVVLVDFWATWCPPCREAFPHTVGLARRHSDRGLRVITVSLDNREQAAQAARFTADHEGPAEHLVSRHGTGTRSFDEFEIDAGMIPYFKLYDRSGTLRYTFEGASPEIDQRVEELLQETT